MRGPRPSTFRVTTGFLALLALLASSGAFAAETAKETALDRYVHAADDAYKFRIVRKVPGPHLTTHVIEMTSQQWRSPHEVNRTLWKHWLLVYEPKRVAHSTGLLLVGGGSNSGEAPSKPTETTAGLATATQSVVAELRMVPNQPLTFSADSYGPRSEDELVAYNWDRFLETGDVNWLTQLPMTKSTVRAMDTVTALFEQQGNGIEIRNFFVTGGSKRGWTAWTTAAVDQRVVGISPIVIDLLNLKKSFIHHYRVYGFWAPAVKDYFKMGIMDRMNEPSFDKLIDIVGPYSYRDRYTMPKFIINSAGDQFFLPDSSRFYFDDLPGEKYLRYVPNSDHSLRGTDAMESLTAFYHALLTNKPRPRFSWKFEEDGAIRVEAQDQPSAVKLWQATNPRHRDFRLESAGPIYKSVDLSAATDGVYVARVEAPLEGFTAYFVELMFPSGVKQPFKFTTGVRVMPGRYPYAEPIPGATRIGPQKQ